MAARKTKNRGDQRSPEQSNTSATVNTYPVVIVGARSTVLLCSAVVVPLTTLSALARVVVMGVVFTVTGPISATVCQVVIDVRF